MKKIMCIFGLMVLLAAPAVSHAIGIEAAVGGWDQDVQGDMSYKAISELTDTIDFENDLKLEDETRPMGRVKIDMPLVIPNIYLIYTPMEFEGVGDKDVNFKFGNQVFTQNTPIQSTFTMNQMDVGLFYSIPLLKMATFNKVNIDLGLNVKVADLEAEVKDLTTGTRESESATVPVPMVYAGVQLKPVKKLSLEVEGRGIAYDDNHLYDLTGRLKYKVFGPLFLAGGYRYESIKLDEDDLKLDTSVDGVFLETGLEF
ncbi:MAG: TIGR04219 family outer membrane beta-barrel protein [Thermodesulfobacteriota bacterium]|nr:TIGR04219 family outer membrane beta-barrel protein [Thermodesulfobacteriota bacterium]